MECKENSPELMNLKVEEDGSINDQKDNPSPVSPDPESPCDMSAAKPKTSVSFAPLPPPLRDPEDKLVAVINPLSPQREQQNKRTVSFAPLPTAPNLREMDITAQQQQQQQPLPTEQNLQQPPDPPQPQQKRYSFMRCLFRVGGDSRLRHIPLEVGTDYWVGRLASNSIHLDDAMLSR